MKKLLLLSTLAFSLSLPTFSIVEAAKANKRDKMTSEQKKELRRRAKEWCMKTHIKGNMQFDRVEILTNGSVRCWMRG